MASFEGSSNIKGGHSGSNTRAREGVMFYRIFIL